MLKGTQIAFVSVVFAAATASQAVGQWEMPAEQEAQSQPRAQSQQQDPRQGQGQPMPPRQGESPQPAPAQPQPQQNVVATVNGEPITRPELTEQAQSLLRAHQQGNGGQARPSRQQVQQQALNNLIEARLVEQYARQQGPDVEDQEVKSVLDGLRESLEGQGVTLEQYLASQGQETADLRKRIESSLAWQKLQEERITPEKLREFYEEHQQRFGEATFEQVQPQVTQLYVAQIWNDIVAEMKPEANIQVANRPGTAPQAPPRGPVMPRQ